ncbi:MAG TPA: DEAD/DEAH box helicase [Spirochaetota bacterium]|nr:DEAD/DEAH box helicase [Spirochaetota bacterium]
MKFIEFELDSRILKGIEKAGFTKCTDVQAETLKYSLGGKDVLVQSQTGTGKTAAFVITMYHLKLTRDDLKDKKILILAPTRELVLQIEKETKLLGSFLDFRIGSFYGGVGYNQQESMLHDGVDILIGTPGRLIDFAGSGKIKFSEIGILIIDEADRMFDMGFYPDIKRMVRRMPSPSNRVSLLFSATLSTRVKNLAWEHMNEPAEINMSEEQITVDKIEQALYHVGTHEKVSLLLGLLKKRDPKNVLIFTNTKHDAMRVAGRLSGNGYECDFIIGDLPQKRRTRIIDNIKSGKLKCLVATDVAARGLHINDLDLVINYDIPEDYESYVHRIGRTARAGKSGMAVTLACEKFVYGLEAIESYIKMKIPVQWAGEDLYVEDACPEEFIREFMRTNRGGKEMPQRGERPARGERKPRSERSRAEKPAAGRGRKAAASTGQQEKAETTPKIERAARPAAKKAEAIYAGKDQKSKNDTRFKDKGSESRKPVEKKRGTGKRSGLDDRMKLYKEKYGEDFKVSREIVAEGKTEKKSLVKRIKSLFRKK